METKKRRSGPCVATLEPEQQRNIMHEYTTCCVSSDTELPNSAGHALSDVTFPFGYNVQNAAIASEGPGAPKPGYAGGSAVARACSKVHKWPREGSFTLATAGQVVQIKCSVGNSGERQPAKRQEIKQWSAKSRRECWRIVSALPWARYSAVLFGTLTYPGREGAELIPCNGKVAHSHFRAFLKRWARQWSKPLGVWKKEFQNRQGLWDHEYQKRAVHFHFWIVLDHEQLKECSLSAVREWVARAWYEIIGSDSLQHLEACSGVELVTGDDARHAIQYFKGYLNKKGPKEYQNQVPEGFCQPGRFWGCIGGFRPEWKERDLTASQFVKLRRLMRRYLQSTRRKKLRYGTGLSGMFVVGGPGIIQEMLRALERLPTDESFIPGKSAVKRTRDQNRNSQPPTLVQSRRPIPPIAESTCREAARWIKTAQGWMLKRKC